MKSEFRVVKSEFLVMKNEFRLVKSVFRVMKREFRVKKKTKNKKMLFSCHRMAITGIFEFCNDMVNIAEFKGLVISFLQHFLYISVIYNKITSTL